MGRATSAAPPTPRTPSAPASPVFDLDPAPPPGVSSLPVQSPDGVTLSARVDRSSVPVRARCDDASEPGVYRLALADPPGGSAYAVVSGDPRESDPAPLDPAEMSHLSEALPLSFEADPAALSARLLASSSSAGRREAWRPLVLAAIGALCVEAWLTRRMAGAGTGVTYPGHADPGASHLRMVTR